MDCLTNEQLKNLLCAAPDLAQLEHAAACEACAARLADRALALPMLEPPAGMRQEILREASARASGESLRSYALRVFAAMAAVLVLLFSGAFDKLAGLPQELPRLKEQIVTIFMKEDSPHAPEAQ